MATEYKGNTEVRETWQSGAVSVSEQKLITIVKSGKMSALARMVPERGDSYDTGSKVVSATLEPDKGGMGTLKIVCRPKLVSGGTQEPPTPESIREYVEVEMAQLEKPLLSKSDFQGYAREIEKWRGAPANVRAEKAYLSDDGKKVTLTGHAAKAAELMMRGVECYLMFAPVISVKTILEDPPAGVGGNCGKIDTPPNKATKMIAGSWKWLKTADTVALNNDGSWTRSEQWTGADSWEEALYGEEEE